ncbi:hypothetical protein Sme01_69710 [Sphaerisporangium melleum]|uniref:Uncharacterized protein n=1 Tax=Sphaerisporangium melleum TaxID=321316 RepID=A0A917RLN8_9ACTN|nr:hypothetical protein GCM10007964_64370 [Sphaerisporangium melleum]GII74495.1 hypothetical protein Sme01_69710 [Sphaerisporangium melleum]
MPRAIRVYPQPPIPHPSQSIITITPADLDVLSIPHDRPPPRGPREANVTHSPGHWSPKPVAASGAGEAREGRVHRGRERGLSAAPPKAAAVVE